MSWPERHSLLAIWYASWQRACLSRRRVGGKGASFGKVPEISRSLQIYAIQTVTLVTVLLVDCDRLVPGYCYNVLTALPDLQVMQCTSGDDAAELASLYAGKIDLLISDICMPGRLDGITLARELTAMRPETKILLMSGRANETMPRRPTWRFIAKPCRPSDLLSKVQAVLHLAAATSVRR